ncbi:MAG TPA: RodZ domain-containing protein [Candidatus Deferrimicrobiaceae bacterium]|nr:RodZ domain-containing protein [Candidatus Deferrimicrobiaceae bacterium]
MGVGEAWKKRREEMGKTLEDVSSELRISKKYLRGIEEGNFSRFQAKVFSTGFIRTYATFLSVDPEPLLSEYLELFERSSKEEPPFHGKPEWLERERKRGSRRTAYAIAAAAVLVIGIFLARYAKHTALRPPPVPEIRQTSQPPPAPVPASVENTALPSDNAAVGGGEAAEVPPVPEQKTPTVVGKTGPASAPSHHLSSLFLEASEPTWIMYSRDGSEPVDVMLYPGDRLSIQARGKIYLKIGNAGGVVGTLNGNLLPSFGEKGQVKEITLGE